MALYHKVLNEDDQYNSWQTFIDNIKQEEINFYQDLIDKYNKELNLNIGKYKNSTDSGAVFNFYRSLDNSITGDYDVHDFSRMINDRGRQEQERRLNNLINNHVDKLYKSVKKQVGEILSIEQIGENDYTVDGKKATCNLNVSRIKLSSNKNSIIKTRFKIDNVQEKPEEPEVEEDNEYIKKWKEQELEGFIEFNNEFWKTYNELTAKLREAKDKLDKAISDYVKENNKYPSSTRVKNSLYHDVIYDDANIEKLNSNYKKCADDRINYSKGRSFFLQYGDTDNFIPMCKKQINAHFKDLQNRVEQYIGKIIKIKSLGGNDYSFEGEDGTCDIEVILAGGYNIQRLHTRWIVINKHLYNNTNEGVIINLKNLNIKKLNEARLGQLEQKTRKQTPTLADRADFVKTDYIGISKFGIYNFRTSSQTSPGNYWYQTLEIPDLGSKLQDEDITPELIGNLVEQDDIKIYCDCPAFLYWAFKYMAYTRDYGSEPETRAPKLNNVRLQGALCKHLLSMVDLLKSGELYEQMASDANNWMKYMAGEQYGNFHKARLMGDAKRKKNRINYETYDSYMNDYFASKAGVNKFLDDEDIKGSLKAEIERTAKTDPNMSLDDFISEEFGVDGVEGLAQELQIDVDYVRNYFKEIGF